MTRTLFCVVVVLVALPATASAFTFESPISDGCHEEITLAAAEATGWPGGASPPAPTRQERLVARDLPYASPAGDPWLLALAVGVRFNDLHGAEALDLAALAEVHNRADAQSEHCLREADDDGPDGDVRALAACRAFILDQVEAALGEATSPDLDARTDTRVALAFHGPTDVEVARFPFHVGRALHALQDSFTHAFRSDDGVRVRHVLNWRDFALSGDYDAARDGFRHISELDDCSTMAGARRAELATRASSELMAALADGAGGRAGRLDRAGAVLDRWLALEPGCTFDNDWCDAPERLELAGCAVASGSGAQVPAFVWGFALLVLVLAVRRRRSSACSAACAAALVLALSAPAHAEDEPPLELDVTSVGPREQAEPTELHAWGLAALVGAGIDRGAFAGRVAGRYRLSNSWEVGLDLELNPWFSIEAGEVVPGAVSGFATVLHHWASAGRITIHTALHVGVSVLLFDLHAADSGAVGPFLGGTLLGVSIRLGRGWALLIEPAEVMLPVPQLGGVPFYYRQYRFTVGIQWNP